MYTYAIFFWYGFDPIGRECINETRYAVSEDDDYTEEEIGHLVIEHLQSCGNDVRFIVWKELAKYSFGERQ